MRHSPNKHRIVTSAATILALVGIGIGISNVNCSDDSGTVATVDAAYENPYLYTSYYPADVAYSSAYWANDWAYPALYQTYGGTTGAGGMTGMTGSGGSNGAGGADASAPATDAGSSSTTSRLAAVGDLIRALARGDTTICPGNVTVNPKTAGPECNGSPRASSRAGVTIVFNSCQIPNAGTVSGTVDVASTHTPSTPDCSAATSITLMHTTTITNLVYTAQNGAKLIIPNQTDTGNNTFTFGQTPSSLSISTNGQLQIYGPDGTLLSDQSHQGTRTFTFVPRSATAWRSWPRWSGARSAWGWWAGRPTARTWSSATWPATAWCWGRQRNCLGARSL